MAAAIGIIFILAACRDFDEGLHDTWVITFMPNNGEPNFERHTDIDGRLSSLPPAPIHGGYPFLGWHSTGGTLISANHIFTRDSFLVALWDDGTGVNFVPGTFAAQLGALLDNPNPPSSNNMTVAANEAILPQNLTFGGQNVTININGGGNTLFSHGFGGVFIIRAGVTLNLNNIIIDGGGRNNTSALITVERGGTLNMNAGTIIRGNHNEDPDHGGGVTVKPGGVFNMHGGEIRDNTSVDWMDGGFELGSGGGGVKVHGGTFNMFGGRITQNAAPTGGGVRVMFGGVFNMNVPRTGMLGIDNNSASLGGGVMVGGSRIDHQVDGNRRFSRMNLIDGLIQSNLASAGGGIQLFQSTIYMHGGAIIENEAEFGGGVGVHVGTFHMLGGEISNNEAFQSGGGVNIDIFYSHFTMHPGTRIDRNTAGAMAAGVLNMGTFEMFGGEISNNESGGQGGGLLNFAVFHMFDGAIFGNTTEFGGGAGIHMGAGGVHDDNIVFVMFGGRIYGNNHPNTARRNRANLNAAPGTGCPTRSTISRMSGLAGTGRVGSWWYETTATGLPVLPPVIHFTPDLRNPATTRYINLSSGMPLFGWNTNVTGIPYTRPVFYRWDNNLPNNGLPINDSLWPRYWTPGLIMHFCHATEDRIRGQKIGQPHQAAAWTMFPETSQTVTVSGNTGIPVFTP